MLTGRRRYREQKRWRKPSLLILQVEVNEMTMIDRWPERCTFWRDAAIKDLTIMASWIAGADFPLEKTNA